MASRRRALASTKKARSLACRRQAGVLHGQSHYLLMNEDGQIEEAIRFSRARLSRHRPDIPG